jgi:hypothetical protein
MRASRYWYKTKKPAKKTGVREMRVFRQYPHGYDVYLGETIKKEIDSNGKEHYIHTLYDRNTDTVLKKFDDKDGCGDKCGFDFSRKIVEETLDPMLRSANQLRRARKVQVAAKRKKCKKSNKK